MTNTDTLDTNATVKQVIQLAEAGCDIVRITAPGTREAANLYNIKNELLKKGYGVPLVADIHFNPKAAEVAAGHVKKIRINPGNYIDRNHGKTDWTDQEIREAQARIAERLYPLINICKKNKTAIRIGTNHGSLSERILSIYGNTPQGMVESAMEFVRIVRAFDFHELVLSMKASNFREMTKANLLLVDKMIEEGCYYPIHLGVTEAGNGEEARIKSAAGIGSLLVRGIGDTIRVSLAEDPLNEIPVAKKLVKNYGRDRNTFSRILKDTTLIELETDVSLKTISGVRNPVVGNQGSQFADLYDLGEKVFADTIHEQRKTHRYKEYPYNERQFLKAECLIFKKEYQLKNTDDLLIQVSTEFGLLFTDTLYGGIWIENSGGSSEALAELSMKILQGLGLRYSKAEFVACPSCGRTKFHLFESFEKVKKKTAHLKGLKIAVMGCIVNGPGEMADADYGYVGAGFGNVTLYKNREAVLKNIDESEAIDALINLIKEGGDWSESK